ncbi:MBL fold metallo-hydrolase [Desulfosarcina ovata]|uniref:MBL fold metallo-hydrolase n=1 Tax=Desulfosarcina ovata subsp. ovata TaxID=2752305 RepID=A0A5K8A9V5_9BACT|nr:MBL fold metallo-hydrolase [Desulfosarcina ovata]BBO89269.1 MBL fold metallo-hydrolase [Desulfosarcina ovata subsp. ovata]
MGETLDIKAVDRVEILTLQDNTIDVLQQDNSQVIQRAMPVVDGEMKNSILAEHGFASMVTVSRGDTSRSMLFDFGYSAHGAAFNVDALGVDLGRVEAAALSHGHLDHIGGMEALVEKTGKRDLPLVVHPAAFRGPRFMKTPTGVRINLPGLSREKAAAAGLAVIDSETPTPMLDHMAVFLGRIPRSTEFEQGAPNLFCEIDGKAQQDPFDDDSAMIFNVRGKGLVVLSGCAHSGIVNTVIHARQVTGIDTVMAIMGGFHLANADVDRVVQPTIDALNAFNPTYVVPTHCTGRRAVQRIEAAMPERFILNMAGTRLAFSA